MCTCFKVKHIILPSGDLFTVLKLHNIVDIEDAFIPYGTGSFSTAISIEYDVAGFCESI